MITTRMPLRTTELRQSYVNGTNSFLKKLPRPKVSNYVSHSYVFIKCV